MIIISIFYPKKKPLQIFAPMFCFSNLNTRKSIKIEWNIFLLIDQWCESILHQYYYHIEQHSWKKWRVKIYVWFDDGHIFSLEKIHKKRFQITSIWTKRKQPKQSKTKIVFNNFVYTFWLGSNVASFSHSFIYLFM